MPYEISGQYLVIVYMHNFNCLEYGNMPMDISIVNSILMTAHAVYTLIGRV